MIRILRIRIRIRNTASCCIVDLPLCALQAAVQKSAAGLRTRFPEVSVSVLDPDSGVFWILIRNPDPGGEKKIKMLNNQKIVLLFTTLYLSITVYYFDEKIL